MLADMEKTMNFVQPIVGIHVRRTDKVGTEAAFHSVEEYMKYVSRQKLKLHLLNHELLFGYPYWLKVSSDDTIFVSKIAIRYDT